MKKWLRHFFIWFYAQIQTKRFLERLAKQASLKTSWFGWLATTAYWGFE